MSDRYVSAATGGVIRGMVLVRNFSACSGPGDAESICERVPGKAKLRAALVDYA